MTINPELIIQGPAMVIFDSQKFWSIGPVVVQPMVKSFPIDVSAYGRLEERHTDLRIEVTFTPSGQFSDELAAILWPYGASHTGASIFAGTHETLVIHGRHGVKLTLTNARVTQMPNLRFGVNKTSIGQVKFTGLCDIGADPSAIASFWAWASETYPGDAGFDIAAHWTAPTEQSWGDQAGFDDFLTESGWEIAFSMRLNEVAVDGFGTVDMKIASVEATATCTPVGPTAAEVFAAYHGALAPGSRPLTKPLNIFPAVEGAPEFAMAAAQMTAANIGYDPARKELGPVTWKAVRTFAEPVIGPPAVPLTMNPLFQIGEYVEA